MRKLYLLLFCIAAGLSLHAQTVPDSCRSEFTVQQSPNNPLQLYTSATTWHNHQKPVTSVCWTWGDGSAQQCSQGNATTPPALTATHTYAANGTYTIHLVVTHDGGCSSEFSRQVIVPAPPVPTPDSCRAEYGVMHTSVDPPLLRHFNYTPWHNHQKAVTGVSWNFGDGSPVQAVSPSTNPSAYSLAHTFPQPGTYNVCLTLSYDGGCQSTRCNGLVVIDSTTLTPDSCRAGFTQLVNASAAGQVVQFVAQPWHNHNKRVTRVCWQFGDGHDSCVNYTNTTTQSYGIQHTYAQPGTFNVCVTITYDGGCQSYTCHNLVLIAPADSCHASYTIQPVSATPLARHFTAQPWHNNGKRVVEVCWVFGDGRDTCISYASSFIGGYEAQHAYQYYGTYNVCVKIRYEGGCQSYFCAPVVLQQPPAPPAPDTTCHAGMASVMDSFLLRRFQALPQGTHRPLSVCWHWGDGSSDCSTPPTATTPVALTGTHLYAAPGNYQVCLTIHYDGGCTAQECRNILVTAPGNCTTTFTDSALSDRRFRFVAQTTIDAGDSILGWRWTFGDGTAAYGPQAEHTFLSGGSYQVCLTMRTRSGCQATSCRNITVAAPGITLLTLVPNPVSTVLHANFYSTSQGIATIRIVNATGLILRTETRSCYPGMNFWQFNVATLPTGFYTMVVQTQTQLAVGAFFKQ